MADLFPESGRLIGMHARSAEARHEQSAEGERLVPNRLGGETEARAATDEPVARIELTLLGILRDRLSVGVACPLEFHRRPSIQRGRTGSTPRPSEQSSASPPGRLTGEASSFIFSLWVPINIHPKPATSTAGTRRSAPPEERIAVALRRESLRPGCRRKIR